MTFPLSERDIKLLCGQTSYTKGEAYCRAGKVTLTVFHPEVPFCQAFVQGNDSEQVTVRLDHSGEIEAKCTCPSLASYDNYCQHIAGVLLRIHATQSDGRLTEHVPLTAAAQKVSAEDDGLANSMLGLFGSRPVRPSRTEPLFESRTALEVEFTCRPFSYGHRKYLFGIELKIGPKRLYAVQQIRDFLDCLDRKEAFVFSRHFTYDPALHYFSRDNRAVFRQLLGIYQNESMVRETTSSAAPHAAGKGGDRMLLIPPPFWENLLAALIEAPQAKLEQNGALYNGIRLSDEPLPLQFSFDQAEQAEGYQLAVQGLDQVIVMDSYGIAVSQGKLLKLQADPCRQLSELKHLLETSRSEQILIRPEQMEPFMQKVVPGLMKLGSVRISRDVSERLVQSQLKARLFLDRVRDRLLAGLEFQYGDIVINPLENADQQRGEGRILVRDGEQEAHILSLMELGAFTKTESGYIMADEEAEYEFLYHIVPQLEQLVQVFATSSVKVRLLIGHTPPIISVDVDERTDWLEFKFDMEGIPESEIRSLLQSLEEKRKYYRMPNGSLMPLESAEFQEIIRFINEVGVRMADVKGSVFRLPAARALHLMDSLRQGNAVKLGKSFRRLLENIRNPDNLDFPVPESLSTVLRDYQIYGYQWLKTLAHYGFGGILADDMGLGKTVQSIAFIVSVLTEIREQKLPVIIVSPASLLYNWRNELKKFAPGIHAVIADGSRSERSTVLKNASLADVIITSYPLLRRDIDLYIGQAFHTLIMDEAQAFKNHTTQTARAVKSIQANYRFALTGTPVENSLEELWSILDAVFPALFGNKQAFSDLTRENVAKRVRPFLLRRLKADVLKELPEKIETNHASELLPEQKKLYMAYLAMLQQETVKHLNEKSFQKSRIKILAGITRLRQLCCHPALFVEGYEGSSAKFEQLLEIIEECRSAGKRMLVFSQFTEMLELIGRELGYQGVPFFYLDGSTPASERVTLCERFNEGERDLFLLSLKAGGTGLNLTGADTVILYDLWWNPAVEQQAADRAHRIGQKNVVQVIRLVTQGTVEDKMYELQLKKKNLIEEVLQPGQEALSTLSELEIRELLMLE